jgi:Tol biopolymer transport system component
VGFAPDGQHIVFAKEADDGANDVFIAGVDGSDVTPVTDTPEADSSPNWGAASG